MRLATYRFTDGVGIGAVINDHIVDLRAIAPSMIALLEQGEEGMAAARAAATDCDAPPLDRTRLLAPVPAPRAFLGVGFNYRDHAAEVGRALPEIPAIFSKMIQAVAAPFAAIPFPSRQTTFDYEGELGIVIGRDCYGIDAHAARSAIAGYVVVNDLTIRALAKPDTLALAKGGPGQGPFGPWITTADEVSDPQALAIRTWVNGELRQSSTTAQLHHGIFDLIAFIAAAVRLQPGDIITTGSPAGSGVGFDPPRWLRPGDVVRVAIDGLGHIENRIVAAD